MRQLSSVGGGGLNQTASLGAVHARTAALSASSSASKPARRVYLALTGIAAKFDVSLRTAHKIVSEPWFPAPVQLFNSDRGHRRWIEDEIDEAIATRAPRETERRNEPERLRLARERRPEGVR